MPPWRWSRGRFRCVSYNYVGPWHRPSLPCAGRSCPAASFPAAFDVIDAAAQEGPLGGRRFKLQRRMVGGDRVGPAAETAEQFRPGDVQLGPAGQLGVLAD